MAHIAKYTSTPTVIGLNAYDAICPKKDLLHMNETRCSGNGVAKCTKCITHSAVTSPLYETCSPLMYAPTFGYLTLRRFNTLRHVLRSEKVANEIDAYHTLSPHLKEKYVNFGFPESKFHIIPNLLDERFLVDQPTDSASPPYQLLYVGSLLEKKGVRKLLPMFERLHARSPNEYTLTIAGDGPWQSSLEAEVKKRGLTSHVAVLGRVPYSNVPSLYGAHDLFVYPGRWDEPFARVFLEALASGTPIVGSDVGDLKQIVGDAGVVTDGTPESLADEITRLIAADALPAMSSAAVNRAKIYQPTDVIDRYEELYEILT